MAIQAPSLYYETITQHKLRYLHGLLSRAAAFCVYRANRSVATPQRVAGSRASCNHAEGFLDRLSRHDVTCPNLPAAGWIVESDGNELTKRRRTDQKVA